MDPWLNDARDAIAQVADLDPSQLELSEHDSRTLLELARIAAHVSGDRTNAPLLCYLIGRAQGSRGLDELADAVPRSKS